MGRTLPVWSTYEKTRNPWMLDFFDQVSFYPVSEDDLTHMRSEYRKGRMALDVTSVEFDVGAYLAGLEAQAPAIESFRARQKLSFDQERTRWSEMAGKESSDVGAAGGDTSQQNHHHQQEQQEQQEQHKGLGVHQVNSHVSGRIWTVNVQPGQTVRKGDKLIIVQAMKMELVVVAPKCGVVLDVLAPKVGDAIEAGDAVAVMGPLRMDITSLSEAYANDVLTPVDVCHYLFEEIDSDIRRLSKHVWITSFPKDQVLDACRQVLGQKHLPLYGLFFGVKDNINVAGVPTTAGCPEFAHLPSTTATTVALLQRAGAICLGKTNLDQFALGLVGVRSPFGIPSCVFNEAYISGGSSSGSAVVVALGLATFALGTDTAGSGRVPAGINNIVGWKPTKGLVSCYGVLPACQSLDCVSVFAHGCADVARIKAVIAKFDALDVYSRAFPPIPNNVPVIKTITRIGVPSKIELFNDDQALRCFQAVVAVLNQMSDTIEVCPVDFEPFRVAADLLYGGPFVSERRTPLLNFLATNADKVHPVTAQILAKAEAYSAQQYYFAQHELMRLKRLSESEWDKMDVLLVPTAPTIYTIQDVLQNPIQLNTNMGYYTNFVNLFDLSALAVPGPMRGDGLGFGVTLVAQPFMDDALLKLGDELHKRLGAPTVGATLTKVRDLPRVDAAPITTTTTSSIPEDVHLVVVGGHMRGLPLNGQLVELGATFRCEARTRPGVYRMFALSDTRPGMVRMNNSGHPGYAVEIWTFSSKASFGEFVSRCVPSPLSVGTVLLEHDRQELGFLCEAAAVPDGKKDISHLEGWRDFLGATAKAKDDGAQATKKRGQGELDQS